MTKPVLKISTPIHTLRGGNFKKFNAYKPSGRSFLNDSENRVKIDQLLFEFCEHKHAQAEFSYR